MSSPTWREQDVGLHVFSTRRIARRLLVQPHLLDVLEAVARIPNWPTRLPKPARSSSSSMTSEPTPSASSIGATSTAPCSSPGKGGLPPLRRPQHSTSRKSSASPVPGEPHRLAAPVRLLSGEARSGEWAALNSEALRARQDDRLHPRRTDLVAVVAYRSEFGAMVKAGNTPVS